VAILIYFFRFAVFFLADFLAFFADFFALFFAGFDRLAAFAFFAVFAVFAGFAVFALFAFFAVDFFAGVDFFAAAVFFAAGFSECTENIAPWGSMPCAIQSPPGTSIGPFTILPPLACAVAADAFASGTIAYGIHAAGAPGGGFMMPPRGTPPPRPNIW
jgi:hypothetical protein